MEGGDLPATARGRLIEPDEDDVSLAKHAKGVRGLRLPARRVGFAWREEVVGGDLKGAQHPPIQLEQTPLGSQLEG